VATFDRPQDYVRRTVDGKQVYVCTEVEEDWDAVEMISRDVAAAGHQSGGVVVRAPVVADEGHDGHPQVCFH
jgi:hypothetical protein